MGKALNSKTLWKSIVSISLALFMIIGLTPRMSLTARADGEHQINNTISDIVNLSITKDGTAVTSASSGDVITLSVVGTPTVGGNGWNYSDRNATRTLMIDGLAVSTAGNPGSVSLAQTGSSLTWTFTMPDEDVYVSFPILTANSSVSVDTGTAAFRSCISDGGAYSFTTHKEGGDYNDTYGYLVYTSNGVLNKIGNDDSGAESLSFRLPNSGTVTIDNGTFFHVGFALWSTSNTGSFTPTSTSGNIVINFTSITKNPQTISANNVDTIYGATDAVVNASVTTGDGALSYSVTSGTDVISVDRDTGAITPLKVGTATIEITAAETSTYRRTTKSITVTVDKADASATAPVANDLTYTGNAQELVTAGTPVGGTMQYALGTATAATGTFDTTIPSETDVGTYYVWYKVVGDSNHNDYTPTDPVTVTIAKVGITPTVSITGWTFGEEANTPSVTGNTGKGTVTYTYAAKGSTDFSATVPTNAGEYTVKATIEETTIYNGATVTADFTIARAGITPTVSITGWKYGETANTPTVTGNSGNGAVTYTYAKKDSSDFSTTVPTEAGEYTVKATIAATDNYKEATVTAAFTIAKADVSTAVLTVSDDTPVAGNETVDPAVTGLPVGIPADGITYLYAPEGSNEFSTEVPTTAGNYVVKAIVPATENYNTVIVLKSFTIEPVVYSFINSAGLSWTQGSENTLVFTAKTNASTDNTFSKFVGILIDGKVVDGNNYTAESGSVIVKLKTEYLNTLSVGEHTITFKFSDGDDISTTFTINAAAVVETPATGETMSMWILVGFACIAAAGAVLTFKKWKEERA